MARETIVRLTDDISGGDADETINFSYRGQSYEIDLSDKNAKAFDKDMAKYVDHARRAQGASASNGRRSSAAKGDRGYDLGALRQWAADNGVDIPARGRISGAVVEQYKAAGGR